MGRLPRHARTRTVEGAGRLAVLFGLAALLAGCGSTHRATDTTHRATYITGHMYTVRQVRAAFDTLGFELKPAPARSGRVILHLHGVRLGNTLNPVRSGIDSIEVIVETRRDGYERPGPGLSLPGYVTRDQNVTLLAGRNYNDEARAALSVLRWTLGRAKPVAGRIVLGRSIGVVSVGEPRKQVEKVLGKGVRRGRGLVSYPREHLLLSYAPHDTLVPWVGAIFTRWSGYRGPAGVHVGSTRADLKPLYAGCSPGQCGLQAGSMPDAPGTIFTMKRGKVVEIAVFWG
jgi:hypothetical protein